MGPEHITQPALSRRTRGVVTRPLHSGALRLTDKLWEPERHFRIARVVPRIEAQYHEIVARWSTRMRLPAGRSAA